MFRSIDEIEVTNPSTNGVYEDVDATDYGVPSNAKAVLIRYKTITTMSHAFAFRAKGSTDDLYTGAYVNSTCYCITKVNDDCIFQAKLQEIDNTYNKYFILGYFYGADCVFYDNQPNISLSATGAWTDIDIGVDDNAVAAIVHVIVTNANAYEFGLRKNGSTDNRHNFSVGHISHSNIIGVDNDIFEGYIENTAVDFYLIGYLKSGNINTNAVDVSLSSTLTFTDIDCGDGISGAIIEVVSSSNLYGASVRVNGFTGVSASASSNLFGHQWMIQGVDADGILEGFIENTAVDFFLIGTFPKEKGYNPLFFGNL